MMHWTSPYMDTQDMGPHCTGTPCPSQAPRHSQTCSSSLHRDPSPGMFKLFHYEARAVDKCAVCIPLERFHIPNCFWQDGLRVRIEVASQKKMQQSTYFIFLQWSLTKAFNRCTQLSLKIYLQGKLSYPLIGICSMLTLFPAHHFQSGEFNPCTISFDRLKIQPFKYRMGIVDSSNSNFCRATAMKSSQCDVT